MFVAFKSKVARPITTSASACRALWLKASLMGVNMTSYEAIEGHIKALRDVPKKWSIPTSFRLVKLLDLVISSSHVTYQQIKMYVIN